MTTAEVSAWSLYSNRQRWRSLAILFLVSTSNYVDRNVISVLLEPIKSEFHVSDTLLGLLGGFCFATFYALFGMPLARWADRGDRSHVITLAVSIWSVMTICCGLAQSFWQLALFRIGVGAGESGAIPPAQSLIADYFPPERRATAIAVFTAAAMAGYLLGFGAGGYIAATHGWRSAFLIVGVPGIALALLSWGGLPEPRRRPGWNQRSANTESTVESFSRLLAKRGFIYALLACILYFFLAYGALLFIPSFLIRVQHVALTTVSITYGSVAAVGSVIGTLVGGWLADRLSLRDIRWLAWLPALACAVAGPLYALAFVSEHFWEFMVFAFICSVLLTGGLPPIFAAIHAICGNARRATAIAIVLFSATLVGGGFGPLATGALSDSLSLAYGSDGLRYSLMLTMTVLPITAILFYLFGRQMPANLEQ